MKINKFHYNNKITNYIFPLMTMYIGSPLFFLYSISLIGRLITGDVLFAEIWDQLLISSLAPVLLPWFVLQEVNMFPGIRIDKNGLSVFFYTYRRKMKQIPWSKIIDISPSTSKFHGKEVLTISIEERVSFWHEVLKRKYGSGETPQIFVTSFLTDFEDLLSLIQEHTSEINE